MADAKRRPVADFLILARDQPNVALGWGLAVIVVLALVGFGVVKAVGGGSSHSAAPANGGAGASAGGPSNQGASGVVGGTSTSTRGTTTTTAPGSTPATPPAAGGGAPSSPADPGGGGGGGGGGSHITAPPPHRGLLPLLPQNALKWGSSPAKVTMKAGAFVRGWVFVTNLSNTDGTVMPPGCSGGPAPMAVQRFAAPTTCPTGSPVALVAHRTRKWTWTWHATQTGRSGAPPLAPGTYGFKIGPVTVKVTVR